MRNFIRTLFVLCICTLPLAAQTVAPTPETLPPNFVLAQTAYQKGNYLQAVELLTPLVKDLPADRPIYRQTVQMLALGRYVLGHLSDAVPYLEQVATWSPDNVQVGYALGVSLIQTRQPDKARAAFARMYGLAPESAAAHLLNGRMLLRQQFEENAEQELNKAVALDPKLPQANFMLGEIAVFRADLERGIALFQKEIALNPAFDQPYYRLGETYTRQLEWDKALIPLQKAIWLNPYFSGPYIVLGKVYLKKSDLGNAENMLRHSVRLDPNNATAHHLLAQTLQQANRPDEAKQEFAIAERLRNAPAQP